MLTLTLAGENDYKWQSRSYIEYRPEPPNCDTSAVNNSDAPTPTTISLWRKTFPRPSKIRLLRDLVTVILVGRRYLRRRQTANVNSDAPNNVR
jgi:hypothetical protein